MDEFLKYVMPYNSKFSQFRLSRVDEDKIKNQAITSLGLKSINQLRDKFEGIAYLENTTRKVVPLLFLSKLLKRNFISIDTFVPKNVLTKVNINKEVFEIKVFDHGTIPQIKSTDETNYLFFLRRDPQTYLFCGVARTEVITEVISQYKKTVSYEIKKMVPFTRFDALETLESIFSELV